MQISIRLKKGRICVNSKESETQLLYRYDRALRSIYDELYELNLDTGTYRIVYHIREGFVTPKESGLISDGIKEIVETMLFSEDVDAFMEFFNLERIRESFSNGKESLVATFRKLHISGKYHWASLTLLPLDKKPEDPEIFLCLVVDIDELKHSHELAEQNKRLIQQQFYDERYRIIVEQTQTLVTEWCDDIGRPYYSTGFKETIEGNYDDRDLFRVWREDQIVYPMDVEISDAFSRKLIAGAEQLQMTLRLKTKVKGFVWYKVATTCIRDENKKIKRMIFTFNDVDEPMRLERTMKYRAEFDPLTGIYNMETFCVESKRLLERQPEKSFAVLRMDINRFKFINEIYGIEEGDKLLCFIARIIESEMKESSTCGRINSDVFCLMVSFHHQKELLDLIHRISERISAYNLGYRVVPSFGICLVEDEKIQMRLLCDRANLALKTIKGNMIQKWAFYDNRIRLRQLEERTIEGEMYKALEEGQFIVYLQPKHTILSQAIVGAEALVRWNHPQKGVMLPGMFIPLFERNGFIIHLDEYVWEEACRILRKWIDKGWSPAPISVNVSRAHIYNPDFGKRLIALTEKYAIDPGLLELELTESTFVENPQEIYQMMSILQEKGFIFSMDDFGSGYSSLNMLKNAPINNIKLDREFLNETSSTERGRTVVQCTVSMAKKLNLTVIAEGVETELQAEFLTEAGCTVAQGFFFSRPMPVDQFEERFFSPNEILV